MTPTGRPRKRRNTRKDAAVDAMAAFGFSTKLILQTIKELQKVYGEDGWPFIEDCSYRVLLEAILEKVNGEETSNSNQPNAETSSLTLKPLCSDVNPPSTKLQTSNVVNPEKVTDESGKQPTVETSLEPADFGVNPSNIILQANNAMDLEKLNNEFEVNHLLSVESGGYTESGSLSTPPSAHDTPIAEGSSTGKRRRRPCYGWFCSSDDDEDLVELRPGPEYEKLISTWRGNKERKKRWDVKE